MTAKVKQNRVHAVLRQIEELKFEDFMTVSRVMNFEDPADMMRSVKDGISYEEKANGAEPDFGKVTRG